MSVPTNLIPTLITGLQEYTGSSTLGYMPYILDGRTYKVQFANIAAVGAVPSSRVIAAGTGLAGGGDLSANRVISIANGGVGFDQLALSGVTQGTYGSGSAIPILTVDSKGRVTSATTAPLDVTGFVPTSRTITAGDGLTGGGALTSNVTLAANFSAATPSALGTASAGTAITVSRGDHVHPAVNLSDTSQTQGALPLGRGGTGDALSPVAGAVVYSTGSKFALTNPGIAGQVLVSAGTDEPQWQTILGTGTVTSVSVSTANGFAGFVANPATVPDITLSTTVTGMLKGDGTGMSAATAGVDYVEPGPYTTSGLTMASARLLGRTTASVGAAQEITVGTGLTLSGGSLVNAAPDQTVSLTAGTAISVSGTYPSFTVTNTAPDQVVSLTGAGTTTVTGTYPSFTITSNDSTAGTVTSVNASGGTTGMSFTGGPVTSAGTLTLNGTLAVANGGTGATNAVAALTNLGAYPASNPAGYTSNVGTVTSVSGTGTVSGLSLSGTVTSAGSLTLGGTLAVTPSDFASQTANTVLAAPNGSAGTPTFRAIVAADIPTLNQNTTGTASNVTGIVAVANGGTGASVAATARSNLSAAASGANTDITSIALTTGTISATPVNGTDIVNKTYADSIASGINFHQAVRLATTAALPANTYNNGASGVGATLTANANGALTVDGVAAVAGNRILVKNEAAGANNGVYTVTQVGSAGTPYILTRATDFDSSGAGVDQIDAGDFFLVTAGSTLSNTSWVQQTPLPITVGTTALVFTQFAAPVLYTAGTGLTLAGTTFSITNTGVSASTYGSASSVPVIAVNAQGQITSASASSIAIAASQITSGALAIANGGTGATSAATALTNLGAYPASNPSGFTSNTGTVTSVNLTAGTGVSVSGGPITASGSITVTNTAPDQVVSLTGSGATTVTGTYPNFTISSTAGGSGTVTSINVSGGTTGLTTSGGPVTTSGTITLAGTLNVANGGTGATTLSSGYVLKGNGTSAVSASVIYDTGTNVVIGGTTANSKLDVNGDLTLRNGSGVIIGTAANSSGWYDFAGSANVNGTQMSHPGTLRFLTASTERMRIDSSGRLFLNATSGVGNEQMLVAFNSSGSITQAINMRDNNASGNGNSFLVLRRSDDTYLGAIGRVGNDAAMFVDGNSYLTLRTGGTERMRIDTSGNVAIGTTVARGNLSIGTIAGTATTLAIHLGYTPADFYGFRVTNVSSASSVYAGAFSIQRGTGSAWSDALSISNAGNTTANVDMRAPIFYDSDNTAFFVDPSSTSVLSIARLSQIEYPSGTQAINFTDASYLYLRSPDGGIRVYLGGADPANYYDNTTHFFRTRGGSNMAYINSSGVYAPIFYDIDNTAYYINPNAGSNVLGDFKVNQNGAAGIQLLSTTGTQSLWIRTGYDGAPTPSVSATNVQFQSSGSSAGTFTFWSGNTLSLTIAGDYAQGAVSLRSTIFYDSNNTAYYLDATSATSLRTVGSWRSDSAAWDGEFNGKIQYHANNWYFQAAGGWEFRRSDSANAFSVTQAGVAIALGDMRAPIFYDSNNTGYYLDPAGTTLLNTFTCAGGITTSGSLTVGNGATASYIYMADSDEGTRVIHCNSNRIGFLTQASGWGSWCEDDGSWRTDTYFQAPIYYDINNTGYYFDGASTSVLFGLTISGGGNKYLQIQSTDNGEAMVRYLGATGPGWYVGKRTSTSLVDTASFHFYSESAGATVGGIDVSGNMLASGSMRAPIFYDNNNTAYYVDPAAGSVLRGMVQVEGDHGSTEIRLTALGATLGSGVTSAMSWWVSEPNVTWNDGGFGYNVTNDGASPGGFGRLNTSFGQAYTRYTTSGNMIFYCTDTAGTRSTLMELFPANYVQVYNDFRAPIMYDSNNTAFFLDPNSTGTSLNVAGAIVAAGNVTAYSDIRIKANVETIPSALDKLDQIRGVTYTRTDLEDKEQRYAGVIAQEIEAVLPEAVRDLGDIKAVDYNATIGLLIQAVKELTDKVKALEAKEQ